MSKTINYMNYLKESLRDSQEAAEYLNAALETGDFLLFALALNDVVDSLGLKIHIMEKKGSSSLSDVVESCHPLTNQAN